MRRSLLLTASLLLAACQLQPLTQTTGKRPATDRAHSAPPSASPSATPSASVQPSTTPSASASVSPTVQPTATPGVPVMALSGIVKIDAHYVIQTGGGNVIATGGGNFISTNGGTVIATGGGNVIATGGGNVIATGGGNVIATGGGNFRLLADTILKPEEVPVGTMLPVRGMGVVPVSLTTRQQLGPAVLTNEKGEYTLNVPQDQKDNFVVYAVVPGKDADDPVLKDNRLHYNVVVTPQKVSAGAAIDEDTSLASAYVMKCFQSRIKSIMVADDAELADLVHQITDEWNVPASLSFVVETGVTKLNKNAREAGFTKTSPNLDEASRAVFTALLANMGSLYDIMVDYTKADSDGVDDGSMPKETAMVALADTLSIMREATRAKLATSYGFDTGAFAVLKTQRQEAGLPPLLIKRPSDLGDFVVNEYLATNEGDPFGKIGDFLDTILVDDLPKADRTNTRLRAACITILGEVGKVMTTNEKAKVDVVNTLRSYGQASTTP